MLEQGNYPKNWAEISLKKDDYLEEYEQVVNFLESK
jgi:hypothetical protein